MGIRSSPGEGRLKGDGGTLMMVHSLSVEQTERDGENTELGVSLTVWLYIGDETFGFTMIKLCLSFASERLLA